MYLVLWPINCPCHYVCDSRDHVLAYASAQVVGKAAEMVKLLLALETSETDHHTLHHWGIDGAHTVGEVMLHRERCINTLHHWGVYGAHTVGGMLHTDTGKDTSSLKSIRMGGILLGEITPHTGRDTEVYATHVHHTLFITTYLLQITRKDTWRSQDPAEKQKAHPFSTHCGSTKSSPTGSVHNVQYDWVGSSSFKGQTRIMWNFQQCNYNTYAIPKLAKCLFKHNNM